MQRDTSIRFQFHKGTIRTLLALCNEIPLFDFNSIKVRLELCTVKILLPLLLYFNSIKVRLERVAGGCSVVGIQLFQFHKGTIRTDSATDTRTGENLFQFHKGTIRTPTVCAPSAVMLYFNSIKVRLERFLQDRMVGVDFHFNSIKVRLERKKPTVSARRRTLISIP